jgi:hypothetical protein
MDIAHGVKNTRFELGDEQEEEENYGLTISGRETYEFLKKNKLEDKLSSESSLFSDSDDSFSSFDEDDVSFTGFKGNDSSPHNKEEAKQRNSKKDTKKIQSQLTGKRKQVEEVPNPIVDHIFLLFAIRCTIYL